MKPLLKILTAATVLLIIAVLGFGWHLKGIYEGYVASTDRGAALYSAEVLEDYGKQITRDLKAKNVEVAILSRAGQPRKNLPKGVDYTHSAFFVRQTGGDYYVFNLYHEQENRLRSYLKTDRAPHFLRLLQEPDAGIIIPDKKTQTELKAFIGSPAYTAMHTKNYSLISNPFDLRWQNCNEFMLYALGGFLWDTTDKTVVKEHLRKTIKPTPLSVSPVRRFYGPKIDERLILADHGKTIMTTTSSDLAELLSAEGRLVESYRLTFK